jgi:hypothetical protein
VNHNLTKGVGALGNIVPVGENAFYFHTQQGKALFGGLGAYGKFFERVSALRWSEGITDSYVAEDIETVIRYRAYGYIVGRAGYIKTEKGWPYQFSNVRNPIRKWSYDSVESVTGKTPLKMIISPYVDWPYRTNNFWLDGFGFYFKKPAVNRYIKWLTVFFLIFDWNIFTGIPFALWIGSLILSQAISYGLLFCKVYDEANGWLRGTAKTIATIPREMYWFFVHMLFTYDETIRLLASNRLGRFIMTQGKGGNIARFKDWRTIYTSSWYAIQKGAFWTFVLILLGGFHPYKAILWCIVFFVPIAAFVAPFLFNPTFEAGTVKKILGGFLMPFSQDGRKTLEHTFADIVRVLVKKDSYVKLFKKETYKTAFAVVQAWLMTKNVIHMVLGFFWGLADTVAIWDYKYNIFSRKEEDRIQRIFIEANRSLLAVLDAKDEATDILGIFQQRPNHYGRLYARAPLPVVFKAIDATMSIWRKIVEKNPTASFDAVTDALLTGILLP